MDSLHVLFSDEGHPVAIRKWSQEPFDDAVEYVRKSDLADLIAAWQHISGDPLSAKASIADLQSMIDVANLKAGRPVFVGATVNGVEHVMIPKALYDEWVAANDAALDWADANARWFDISTAPLNGGSSAKFQILFKGGHFEDAWSYAGKIWVADQDGCDCQVSLGDVTHWRPIQNPPPGQLPAPLEALGAVLKRVKEVS